MVNILSVSLLHAEDTMRAALGAWHFDIKAGPMGPAPAAHNATHEDGGMDEVDVTGLSGLLADAQTPANHATKHELGGSDPVDVSGLVGTHARQHDITDTDDHTSTATPGQILQADANGLPVDATNTDAEVADAVRQSSPQTLTDQAAIDWDLDDGGAAEVTLAGDRTLNAPTNMVDGARYHLKVIQDGTGTRLLTWNAVYRFPGGVAPCLSAAPGNIDILQFDCDGTNMDCVGMVSAVA
jgi:hypothetical protein